MFIKVNLRDSKVESLVNISSIQTVDSTVDGKAALGLLGYDNHVKLEQSYENIVKQLQGLIIDNKGIE